MRASDKARLISLVESVAEQVDRTSAYDAIAAAERDESDVVARESLRQAALALLRSQHDASHLDRVRELLGAITPED
jgi:hypothetical protein